MRWPSILLAPSPRRILSAHPRLQSVEKNANVCSLLALKNAFPPNRVPPSSEKLRGYVARPDTGGIVPEL